MTGKTDDRPLMIFDGDCSFCRAWVEYWKRLTGDQVRYAPFQEVAEEFPQLTRDEFAGAVKLILPDGQVRSGAYAVFTALASLRDKSWLLWLYEHLPCANAVCEAVYGVVSRHRWFALQTTRLLWGIPLVPETYQVTSWLFLRWLGAIYLVAFVSFGVQAAGLIGSQGILPAADFLREAHQYLGVSAQWNVPTLLWLNSGDGFLRVIWIGGVCLSLLLLFGMNWKVIRLGLFVLYLSLDTAGQVFMSYQWDALLLEAGFLAVFLGSEVVIVRLFRWLLCRLMFLSGAVKLLSGDPTWRNFTALPIHYQTQPLPTPLAWYFYQLPAWFQRVSLGYLFLAELVAPLLVLAPRRIRFFAAFAITLLQVLILLTGNYAFFNFLTIGLCLFVFDDVALAGALPRQVLAWMSHTTNAKQTPLAWRAVCGAVACLVLFTSGFEMVGQLSMRHWALADSVIRAIAPFEIVNTYGLFAVMTTSRPEIVIEGSSDGVTWLPYEFKYKPGDLTRHPSWVEPHQPRLDWQMWFAALGNYRSDPWILHLLERLLAGSPPVLGLVGRNPFPDAPPRYIRAQVYDYRFTTPEERQITGQWWHREWKGIYVPEVSLH
jgi:predicted DCC family thiol-disulfide oxidoreductase YuxK